MRAPGPPASRPSPFDTIACAATAPSGFPTGRISTDSLDPALSPLLLSHFTATTCLGHGLADHANALREQRGGLAPCRFEGVRLQTHVGEVPDVDAQRVPEQLAAFDCRNNRLAWLALQQDGFAGHVVAARERYGPRRIGVFLGTSTGGILETERAYRRRDATGALPADFDYARQHSPFALPAFVRACFGLTGPAAVSSACSSGAKVFASARRMIEAGWIDAAVVGGVDTLCLTTLYGFDSLELVSAQPCRPYDVARNGISIGEGAGFALLERAPTRPGPDAILLSGIGESSDAHHMSSPHPEGLGARMAMAQALSDAGLSPADIDYINLHGTATRANDAAEGRAVLDLFGATPCSSTKGATGHTLGAAGAVEAVIAALALREGFMPAGIHTATVDPALPVQYLLQTRRQPMRHVMSNAFGFGGSNCSLLFSRADAACAGADA
ncbi:3-oxoacyl-[acyl-carrier-protein] synthase-1 [Cupriavidus gilardii J11]|uniref:3-oxoacyl-[acyl-carrier-protein] synthase-1 n=1 Tax=Cupriavidus gilardii J11 TaxID=936133 RepID=A0A562BL28_9BURK|nr:3-oxoacyl-[acyl-carrier-protein] synthase-1 [Cupriavidus gilardii J11]